MISHFHSSPSVGLFSPLFIAITSSFFLSILADFFSTLEGSSLSTSSPLVTTPLTFDKLPNLINHCLSF